MTAIFSIFSFFLSPVGRILGIALIALGAYGAWDLHIRSDEKNKILHNQAIERQHAVTKGNAARGSAVKRFDAGRLHDDGWARD